MDGPDSIHLANVLLAAHIGVSEAERAAPQPLGLFLTLHLAARCEEFSDDIARTANYSAVRQTALALAAERPRRLLETLAADLAAGVLAGYPACAAVEVELRKWVLPDTDFVAVRLLRRRHEG